MGPHQQNYIVWAAGTLNGEYVKAGELSTVNTISDLNILEKYSSQHILSDDSFQFETVLEYPHFSRKRFVKKLMGLGISRNAANKYAKYCAVTKMPYGQQWYRICWMGIFG